MRDDYQNALDNKFNVQNTQGVEINLKPDDRIASNYTNKDSNWNFGTHSGDVYISTPNATHNQIVDHHKHMNNPGYDGRYNLPEDGKYPGVSGFFTNEDTASKSFTEDGKFDSVSLGHGLQQAPYYNESLANELEKQLKDYTPEYNGNLDCFQVNPEKMKENYGTTDFYAVMSSCNENTAWGDGGGFQGYNPYINEMINNGSLEYVPEKSRSCDFNECFDYAAHKNQALSEARAVNDHIEVNNIKGSDGERLGYNEISHKNDINVSAINTETEGISSNNVESIYGGGSHAPPTNNIAGELPPQTSSPAETSFEKAGTLPKEEPPNLTTESQIAGTTPDKKQDLGDFNNDNTLNINNDKSNNISSGITGNNGIM